MSRKFHHQVCYAFVCTYFLAFASKLSLDLSLTWSDQLKHLYYLTGHIVHHLALKQLNDAQQIGREHIILKHFLKVGLYIN